MDSLSDFLVVLLAHGKYEYVALALVMTLTSLMPVPRATTNIVVGAIFGMTAIPFIVLSTTAGAVCAFLLGRYLFAERVQRYANNRPKLRSVLRAVDQEGWRMMALLRFCSPVPGVVQNYLYGVTKIGVLPFAAVTLIFPTPLTCLYVYLGSIGRSIFDSSLSFIHAGIALIATLCLIAAVLLVKRRTSQG